MIKAWWINWQLRNFWFLRLRAFFHMIWLIIKHRFDLEAMEKENTANLDRLNKEAAELTRQIKFLDSVVEGEKERRINGNST